MKTSEVRKKFSDFLIKRGHVLIPTAPLVPENDPTTLFTSSGMQPLVPYLLGQPHPSGSRLVDSQLTIRLQDIEEVGDNRHTTFFVMLGNWSLNDYFKAEQLDQFWNFLTDKSEGLGLSPERIFVSIFEGNESVPRDETSFNAWISLGVPKERIFEYGVKKNWWSRSGTPEQMPAGEIGGPDSEVFFDFGVELGLHKKSAWKDEPCHPNCDCGRFLEIGNSVFIQYKKTTDGNLEELPQKNVDFGGGLERLVAATNNNPDVFEIDIFAELTKTLEVATETKYQGNEEVFRVIEDHVRAATFLALAGVVPDNKQQGYVMRRLVRRAAIKLRKLMDGKLNPEILSKVSLAVSEFPYYKEEYFGNADTKALAKTISDEAEKFASTLGRGFKIIEGSNHIDGKIAFDLYQSYGFPLEITEELTREKGQEIDKVEFANEFEKHKNLSRTASAGTFKGGLADHSVETTRLHTATHLLHAALRKTLGNHVSQKGSNITAERLRFDFSHDQKLTEEELGKVEKLINGEIDLGEEVVKETMPFTEATKMGAMAFFGEKYGEVVDVYSIGDFSREVCGGPHVGNTKEVGHVRITKQEKLGTGLVRIYAVVD